MELDSNPYYIDLGDFERASRSGLGHLTALATASSAVWQHRCCPPFAALAVLERGNLSCAHDNPISRHCRFVVHTRRLLCLFEPPAPVLFSVPDYAFCRVRDWRAAASPSFAACPTQARRCRGSPHGVAKHRRAASIPWAVPVARAESRVRIASHTDNRASHRSLKRNGRCWSCLPIVSLVQVIIEGKHTGYCEILQSAQENVRTRVPQRVPGEAPRERATTSWFDLPALKGVDRIGGDHRRSPRQSPLTSGQP